jgi:hypothetical protein
MENVYIRLSVEGARIETTIRDMFTYDYLRNIGNFVAIRQGTQLPIQRQVIVDHMWVVKDEVKDRVRDLKYNNIQ